MFHLSTDTHRLTQHMPAHGPVRCLWRADAALGEGALWSAREQALYWVDILGQQLMRWSPGRQRRRQWRMAQVVTAVAERENAPGLLLAMRDGVYTWDPAQPDLAPALLCALGEPSTNRCNDGHCDAQGRFWLGTMDFDAQAPSGALYRIDSSGMGRAQAVRCAQGIAVVNGPTWLADQRTLLFCDTVRGRVLACDVEPTSGQPGPMREWLRWSGDEGLPDGLCTDEAGRVWIAHWDGGCVSCHEPTQGRLLGRIALPTQRVTSCAFGGEDLCTLYITTARTGLSATELAAQPLAGALFSVRLSQPGRLAHRYAG